jgi:hypothetical protein
VEIAVDRGRLESKRDDARSQEGLEFGPEDEHAIPLVKIERLLTHPIAPEEQGLFALVPESKREHAPQMVDTPRPMLLVEMDDDFAVAIGLEGVSAVAQLLAQLDIVVDFAIRDEGY